uniref:F-box domain-containing protein n=1 Tax=Panagrellus redivivus TaxID=6233 RepID=A0A7E4VSZ9_PANRE
MNSPVMMFPSLPYALRQQFYSMLPPAEFELLRQCFFQQNFNYFLNETTKFGLFTNKLYINSVDESLKFISSGNLIQKVSVNQLKEFEKVVALDVVHLDQLSTSEIAEVAKYLHCEQYQTLSLTGFPLFDDFAKLLHPGIREMSFSGHVLGIPSVDAFLRLLVNMERINITQFWQIQYRAEITRILEFFISRERPENLKSLRYNQFYVMRK